MKGQPYDGNAGPVAGFSWPTVESHNMGPQYTYRRCDATDMKRNGMYNIGQLARERYPDQTALVGFGSYQGKVIAANSWGAPTRGMDAPPAKEKSWEALLHSVHAADQLLWMEDQYSSLFIENSLGHRAIGVVYNPET